MNKLSALVFIEFIALCIVFPLVIVEAMKVVGGLIS